ncbi:hypothetical protein [Streptomyces sp. NPDC055140]
MLLVADEMGLEPPLPERFVEARRVFNEQRAEDRLRRKAAREQARQHWELSLSICPVKVTVHSNLRRGQMRRLEHVVPEEDVLSGRSRLHVAGRALCEDPDRAIPRHLGEAIEGGVATCRNCLNTLAVIRSSPTPAPATAAKRALLQLIASGAVFTLRPGHGQPTIRDTTQRSSGTAWGHLGRKVDAAVNKVAEKGWARVDDEYSRTQLGHLGHVWRLTDSGISALEG